MYGRLEKLMVIAYKSESYSDSDELGRYQAQVNPEGYQTKIEVKFHEPDVPGSSGSSLRFDRIKNNEFTFKLLFDGTGVLDEPGLTSFDSAMSSNSGDITEQIEKFNELTIKYHGEIHRPPFVKLIWGPLVFKGQVYKLDYDYKLFGNSGKPIRAIATVVLKGSKQDTLRIATENPSSPDLTHVKVTRQGDNLPLLCHQVYQQVGRYIQVAQINDLDHFREIHANRALNFPPISKNN